MLIIDAHCHAGSGDGLTGPWDTNAPLKQYVAWANQYKINRTNLFAAFHSDYAKANLAVANIVRRHAPRFYGFAFVHPVRDAGRIFTMVKTAVEQYQFTGIKVHRYDARITREICETARFFSIPVLYDVMGEVHSVHLLAAEYPDVNFIIPHLSSFADDWKSQQAFIDPLSRYPNIYTDSSGVRRFDLLKEAIDRAGAHKMLYGSDGPWLHPGVELEKIIALRTCEKELSLMLAGNFLRLIQQRGQHRNSNLPANVLQSTSVHHLNAFSLEHRDPWVPTQSSDVS